MPREMPLQLVEVPAASRRNVPAAKVRELEADRLLGQLGTGDHVVVLDERGKSWSTLVLAENLDDWRMQGRNVAVLVGGADGLHARCLDRADDILSLSAMTLPHALVRVLLAEQIYRAWTVRSGHPYHRGG